LIVIVGSDFGHWALC